jgi:hypothetical protein
MEEKKKRGRPKKTVDPAPENLTYDKPVKVESPVLLDGVVSCGTDEPPKYQTTPMSNWAIENRKKKLGLKD